MVAENTPEELNPIQRLSDSLIDAIDALAKAAGAIQRGTLKADLLGISITLAYLAEKVMHMSKSLP